MPTPPSVILQVRALASAGRWVEARRAWEARPDPWFETIDGLTLRAEIEVATGNLSQGAILAKRVLGMAECGADTAYSLGFLLHRHGRGAEAADAYRKCLALAPSHLDAWCNLGAALQALGRHAEAIEAYRKALTLKPDFAEVLGNLGNACLSLKRHAEAVESLSRAVTLKPGLAPFWNSLGVALRSLGRDDEAREAYGKAIAAQPGYAEAHANLGTLLRAKGELSEAEAAYRRSLALLPRQPEVLNNLGVLLLDKGLAADAEATLRQALALAPGLADAHCNLGNALLAQDRPDQAETCFRQALCIKPGHYEALCDLGNSHLARNRLDEALACYEEAGRGDPTGAEARFNQSLVHLLRGDFARGWPLYEHRFDARRNGARRVFNHSRRLDPGADPSGLSVLVHAEQGLGDTLQFARLLPALRARGARVVAEVQAPLVSLIAASGLADEVRPSRSDAPECALFCPLLSLPGLLGVDPTREPPATPYLRVPGQSLEKWRARLGPARDGRLRVGIVWSGNPKHRNDRRRSISLRRLASVFDGAGVELFSLQKERRGDDAQTLAALGPLTDLSPELDDFCDTAAAMLQLDLVLTVDTSVAHLAGALGRPTWVLLPFAPDWRWMLGRDDSPWYPTLRLWRQPAPGDWDSVLERIRESLAGMASAFSRR